MIEQLTLAKLKTLKQEEISCLAEELRQKITEAVSKNGGHLASNLGVVELTIALHRVFDSPKDKIIFDVGHQCYVHKMLTGRLSGFENLRKFKGMSGFPKSKESPHDVYETGHASTALSAAVGMARARDILKEKCHVIAVVGDGAFTGGMCYEALNDAGSRKTPLIVVLNDNSMSIAPNVGAMNNYLSALRTSRGWMRAKRLVSKGLQRLPLVGGKLYKITQSFKNHVRNVFVKDSFFSSMGFRYLGPFDGHDEAFLEKMLTRAKQMEEPVLLHVVTTKGSGYRMAEETPDRWHGTAPFNVEDGQLTSPNIQTPFAKGVRDTMLRLAKQDKRVVSIVAAMGDSTGMDAFSKEYPERFFDVGIAEQHAVTLAAGMAKNGLRPFVAIYDTFMQRAYDQVIEDVALQNLPVVFLMDRAGLGGDDGPTHHGVFGLNWMRQIPNLKLFNPRNIRELSAMMERALALDCPVAIRYPKAEGKRQADYPFVSFQEGRFEILKRGRDVSLIATSQILDTAIEIAEKLEEEGVSAEIVNASSVKPLDRRYLSDLGERNMPYVVIEENQYAGGLASSIMENALENNLIMPLLSFALADAFVEHGDRKNLLQINGLAAEHIFSDIIKRLKADETKG